MRVPWAPIAAFVIAALASVATGRTDWWTWGTVGCLHVAFFAAGAVFEMDRRREWIVKSMEKDAAIALQAAKLSMQYQRLHFRHFQMTGENYADDEAGRGRHGPGASFDA